MTERKPPPRGVVIGPLMAILFWRTDSRTSSGRTEPYFSSGVEAGFAVLEVEGDAGGLEDADGGVHDLGADAVAGDNGDAVRHG